MDAALSNQARATRKVRTKLYVFNLSLELVSAHSNSSDWCEIYVPSVSDH